MGDWAQSLEEFEQLAADDRAAKWAADFRGRVAFHHAQLLIDVARATQAQRQLRSAIGLLTSSVGEKHLLVAESHAMLGRALAESGRYSEAVTEFEKAEELATQWAPPDTWTAVRPRYFRALLKLRQDEPAVAAEIL